jgi:SAM-dependent methyltransferase
VTAPPYGAREGYDALAPAYDLLTAGHDHDAWAELMERLARAAGLSGCRLLDVGCGTGSGLVPMLERGYVATGVDVSPGMLRVARAKLGDGVALHEADMRALPALGTFDLVWSLGDAVNHLLDETELVATFAGFRRNLAESGIVAFDVDTLVTFRRLYSSLIVVPEPDRVVIFEGRAGEPIASGGTAEAWIDRVARTDPPFWERVRSTHRQRHHPRDVLERSLAAAGLELAGAWGTDGAGAVEQPLDELRHTKAMYIARVSAPSEERG